MICRAAAVATRGAAVPQAGPGAGLSVLSTTLSVGRDTAATAAASPETGLAPSTTMICRAAAVTARRTTCAKPRACTSLSVLGTAVSISRDAPAPGVASAETRLAPSSAMIGRAATVAAGGTTGPKGRARAGLSIGTASAIARDIGRGGAGAEGRLAAGAAVIRRAATETVSGAAVSK
jgi:hypothetical protein